MVRLACINTPSLALQLLCGRNPSWRERPAAVLTENKPLGIITAVNRKARDSGVRTGMRYTKALAVEPYLHADAVSPEELSGGGRRIHSLLSGFSPEVEPFGLQEGVFWINAAGLDRLYPSLARWVCALQHSLLSSGFTTRVVVGFTRFGTFAAAKCSRYPVIFISPEEERVYVERSPVAILPMDPKTLLNLQDLGVRTIGAFAGLPDGGIRNRFSKETAQWHAFAAGAMSHPLQPVEQRETLTLTRSLQPGARDTRTVLHHLEQLLDHLLSDVMKHNELVCTLSFAIHGEEGDTRTEEVTPARPTVQHAVLARLIRLRLESLATASAVVGVEMRADRVAFHTQQLSLFQPLHARSVDEGAEAFALIKAELGNDSVQVARLRQEHLPERQFDWVSVDRPALPRPASGDTVDDAPASTDRRCAVRRMLKTPRYSGTGETNHRGVARGGPFSVSTDWWSEGVERDYYYLESSDGSLHWAYYDHKSGRWMLQGSAS